MTGFFDFCPDWFPTKGFSPYVLVEPNTIQIETSFPVSVLLTPLPPIRLDFPVYDEEKAKFDFLLQTMWQTLTEVMQSVSHWIAPLLLSRLPEWHPTCLYIQSHDFSFFLIFFFRSRNLWGHASQVKSVSSEREQDCCCLVCFFVVGFLGILIKGFWVLSRQPEDNYDWPIKSLVETWSQIRFSVGLCIIFWHFRPLGNRPKGHSFIIIIRTSK